MREGAVGAHALIIFLALVASQPLGGQTRNASRAPQTARLYVLDGGTLESDPARYRLTKEEISAVPLSVTAFLIVHPKGTLMWDTGAIADDSWTPTGRAVPRRFVLSNGQERRVTLRTTMKAQLAAIGYAPTDITYLALSHYHWDHTANANQFVKSTWLARQVERDAMLPRRCRDPPQPSTFADLRNGKTVLIDGGRPRCVRRRDGGDQAGQRAHARAPTALRQAGEDRRRRVVRRPLSLSRRARRSTGSRHSSSTWSRP